MSSSNIIEIIVPVLPESVQDATIAVWHKKIGDQVKRDENLVDLETDKVVLEVPAPNDGVLTEILKPQGSTVVAQELIAKISTTASAAPSASVAYVDSKPDSTSVTIPLNPTPDLVHKIGAADQTLGPSARRAASETSVSTENMVGSGKDGRITKADVLQKSQESAGITANNNVTPMSAQDKPQQLNYSQDREEKRVPMTRLRARIAQRLVQSQHTAAILTTFNEINMQPVMDIRAKFKDEFEKEHGVKLGFMSFFVRACVEALKRFPAVNASIDGNDIVYHGYFDIGVAISSDRGLVVPILKDADKKSMAMIETEIRDFGVKAQKGQLTIEEMTGGTFTVSNGGVFGSLLSTPIINPPQSAILGMHKIEERPIVENKQIVIRPMMYVAMSYDHRIIDGKESVSFLRTIKETLEDPARLILEV